MSTSLKMKSKSAMRILINPFSTNVPLLYPLKTENLQFSDVFKGYRSEKLVEIGLIMD